LLRRFLRRFMRRFWRTVHGRLEVFVGRHQVMPHGDAWSVAQPACYHLERICFDEFCFPAGPLGQRAAERLNSRCSHLSRSLPKRLAVMCPALLQNRLHSPTSATRIATWQAGSLHGVGMRARRACSAGRLL
jgi:hypothetical protein